MQQTPVYSGQLDAPQNEDIDALGATAGARFGASLGEDIGESTSAGLVRMGALGAEEGKPMGSPGGDIGSVLPGYESAPALTPEIPVDDARKQVKAAKLDKAINLPTEGTIRQGALDLMMDHAKTEAQRQEVIAAGPQGFIPSALDAGTSLFVGAVDPLNVAAFSIPVMGEARYGYLMERAGQSVMARAGVRAAVGGGQGLLGSTILTPLDWASKTAEGRDYTFSDALDNMIQNAGAGALLHAGPSALADAYRKVRGIPLPLETPHAGPSPAPSAAPGGEAAQALAEASSSIGQTPEGDAAPGGETTPRQAPHGIVATGIPQVDEVLRTPEVSGAIATPTIDRTHDVPYGAGSSRNQAGVTYVDRHVPAEAEINGIAFDPATFVNIHEQAKRYGMEQLGLSYREAHTEIATPAERAAVEQQLGAGAWAKYSELWDGWLSHIEHENPANPPPDLFDKPYPLQERLALERKVTEEGGAGSSAPTAPAPPESPQPLAINPAETAYNALPERAREDSMRAANANLINGEPVQVAQMLAAAAQQDPRIAAALAIHDANAPKVQVFEDVRRKLIAAGMSEEEASYNAAVWAARYAARAERTGAGSAADLYRGENVSINPGEVAQAQTARSFNQPVATAPTFHSAVARAVDSAKQTKASPEQWLATIRNTAGVKPEEMKWLGLEDWLKEQSGPVTKDQVTQYVNDNNIQVKEVARGAPAGATNAFEAVNRRLIEKYGGLGEAFAQWTDAEREEFDRVHGESFESGPASELPTKYGSYTLPGGENYRELLLTLPEKAAGPSGDLWQPFREEDGNWNVRNRETGELAAFGTMARDEEWARGMASGMNAAPQERPYISSHWDEPNVLAHIRFDDRTVDGQKALHIAEVQSDWHQQGRKQGYREEYKGRPIEDIDRDLNANIAELFRREPSAANDEVEPWGRHPDLNEQRNGLLQERQIAQNARDGYGVPDAPFKTSWPELSMKRMIRYAAENGYDRITWDTGATNAERYDLSKRISSIVFNDNVSGSGVTAARMDGNFHGGTVIAKDHSGQTVVDKYVDTPDQLADLIGKEAAEKILQANAAPARTRGGMNARQRKLEGLDLKVGGEGMHGFYDKILPTAVNKLVKKFGGKVGEASMDVGNPWHGAEALEGESEEARAALAAEPEVGGATKVHSLSITPAMKEGSLSEGFPLFQSDQASGVNRGQITLANGNAIIRLFEKADKSTFMHESSHLWLDEMMRDAEAPGAPLGVTVDRDLILDWLGVGSADQIGVEEHEKFASAFELYLATGRAPSLGLRGVFQKMAQWLTSIYRDLSGLGAPLSDDVRDIFDRMLATPAEIAERDQASQAAMDAQRARAPAPARPNALASQPQTMIGFLKNAGGLRDDPELTARELRKTYPGLMNNRRGMSLDAARQAAAEAGFLGEPVDEAMANTDVNDFLHALDNHPTYRPRDADRLGQWRDQAEQKAYRQRVDGEIASIEAFAERTKFADPKDKELIAHAAELAVEDPHLNYDDALERAHTELYNRDQAMAAAQGGALANAEGAYGPGQDAQALSEAGRGAVEGERPGGPGDLRGPYEASQNAERSWRALQESRGDPDGPDVIAASEAARTAPEPMSIEPPAKSQTALDKSLQAAEEEWRQIEPFLDPAERDAINAQILRSTEGAEQRATSLRETVACLMVATG